VKITTNLIRQASQKISTELIDEFGGLTVKGLPVPQVVAAIVEKCLLLSIPLGHCVQHGATPAEGEQCFACLNDEAKLKAAGSDLEAIEAQASECLDFHAREDISLLVAEVRRLREENNSIRNLSGVIADANRRLYAAALLLDRMRRVVGPKELGAPLFSEIDAFLGSGTSDRPVNLGTPEMFGMK